MPDRDPKIVVSAQKPAEKIENSAAMIMIHGYGDTADTFETVAQQFQGINKLPHMQWIIPNAPENRDAMDRAWYVPTGLSPIPAARPELETPEDEDGLMESRNYIVSLIDELVDQGVPANRIVVGGFSQGCAMSLLVGTTSKYSGKLAGIIGIAGYLPLAGRIPDLRREAGLPEKVDQKNIFLSRGTADMLIPKRFFTNAQEKLKGLGVPEEELDLHEHQGLGHSLSGRVLQDFCEFLEKIVPPKEGS